MGNDDQIEIHVTGLWEQNMTVNGPLYYVSHEDGLQEKEWFETFTKKTNRDAINKARTHKIKEIFIHSSDKKKYRWENVQFTLTFQFKLESQGNELSPRFQMLNSYAHTDYQRKFKYLKKDFVGKCIQAPKDALDIYRTFKVPFHNLK